MINFLFWSILFIVGIVVLFSYRFLWSKNQFIFEQNNKMYCSQHVNRVSLHWFRFRLHYHRLKLIGIQIYSEWPFHLKAASKSYKRFVAFPVRNSLRIGIFKMFSRKLFCMCVFFGYLCYEHFLHSFFEFFGNFRVNWHWVNAVIKCSEFILIIDELFDSQLLFEIHLIRPESIFVLHEINYKYYFISQK